MKMKRLFPVFMVVLMLSVSHAGLTPTYLPESSYYQGRHSFSEDIGGGVTITGRLEFAVYKGTQAADAVAATGYTGDADYVYAYQIFNDQQSDAAITYFAVTGVNPGAVESDAIDAIKDYSGTSGIEPSTFGFNAEKTKGIWEFDNALLIQGEKSWFLFIYSNSDWVAGAMQLKAVYDDDIPVPSDDPENNVPEPVTLALLAGGAILSFRLRNKR